jgi:GntR family transcriptional regulator / MocR family aminotransferase
LIATDVTDRRPQPVCRLIPIDRDSREPLYRQVRKAIEQAITSGRFSVDAPLPSSRHLALALGVSRNTVKTAYEELTAEGFVVPVERSGFYVNRDLVLQAGGIDDPSVPYQSESFWRSRLQPRLDDGLAEIEKVGDWDRYRYPFIAGQFDPAIFPTLAWSRAMRSVLHQPHLHYSLRDGITDDDPLLVKMLCLHVLPSRGIEARPEEVLITMGSQEGLHLVAEGLLGAGSVAAFEEPGYPDARHIFARAGATLRAIPVDGDGLIVPDDLDGIDTVYVTPSHQFPTNVTMSIGRRQQLLARAARAGTVVIEDDYDSELRYRGSPTLALKALDGSSRVIYVGTFSKFLAPGLRVGYLVADEEVIQYLRMDRRYAIRHPPGLIQRALALLIESGQYQRALRHARAVLQAKWLAMSAAVERHLPPAGSTAPPGGVSIWYQGPPALDCVSVVTEALTHGVIVERGDIFFERPEIARNHLRLGFGSIGRNAIDPGIRSLAGVIERHLAQPN